MSSEKGLDLESARKLKSNLFSSSFIQPQITRKYKVHFNQIQFMSDLIIELPENATIQQLAESAGEYFLKMSRLESQKLLIYMSKKNGLPKTDYPPFENTQNIFKTGTNEFALDMVFCKDLILSALESSKQPGVVILEFTGLINDF